MKSNSRLRIGNQTAFSAADPLAPFQYAIEHGFDAFEWFPDKKDSAGWDIDDLDQEKRRVIRQQARDHGMVLSVHAPWWANPLDEAGRDILLANVVFGAEIGAVLFNIHFYGGQGIEAFARAISPLIAATARSGLKLAIENTVLTTAEDCNRLFALLAADPGPAGAGHVGLCLDIGHANLSAATRNDYLRFVDQLSSQVPIIHIHLHENYGDHDSHLPLFTGPAASNDAGIRGLLARLSARGFAGAMILEQWPEPPTLLNAARDRLLAMLASGVRRQESGDRGQETEVCSVLGAGTRGEEREKGTQVDFPRCFAPSPIRRFADSPTSGGRGQEPEVTSTSSCSVLEAGTRSEEQEEGSQVDSPRSFGLSPVRPSIKIISGASFADSPIRRFAGSPTPDEEQGFLDRLIAMNLASRSFREKLAGLDSLLKDCADGLSRANLVYIAAFLRFLGTGELACAEDGRHFRPSHHARLAQQILRRLAALTTAERDGFLLRRIEPWLPSFDSAFVRAEPLTRIRDIAHRNDIPHELKKELKETLQNKLHRCAGPEDLTTSAALLKRITAPDASLPPAFVQEFSHFHRELQEFFNANPLRERLAAMLEKAEIEPAALVRRWLALRAKPKYTLKEQLARLRLLTELRCRLRCCPAGKTSESAARGLRLADIGLEDHAFVLLSSFINDFTAASRDAGWPVALAVLASAIANLRASGIAPAECPAIEADLAAWQQRLAPADHDWLLLVKATLERCQRLADTFTDQVLSLFTDRVARLGTALGVAESAIRVYAESDIRGHLVFQVAKLSALLLKQLRLAAGLSAWDVLVPGTASGRLVEAAHLGELTAAATPGEQQVVLLAAAEGDEEMPLGVAAILLAHELPRLSHLAVRARQAGAVFVAYEEREQPALLRRYLGQRVGVEASADALTIGPAACQAKKIAQLVRPRIKVFEPAALSGRPLLELQQVTEASGGAKAAGARRLAELAGLPAAGFKTPPAVVVPFGVMEAALQAAPVSGKQYHELITLLEKSGHAGFCATATKLRRLIEDLMVPECIRNGVVAKFGHDCRLIVRSSANCEDLKEMAAAGLYDSIANVRAGSEGLAEALRRVWGSLWGQRAAASRLLAAIPHRQVRMAAIIQELIVPDYSFVIHTVNPINHNRDEIYIELAVGLGEAIASGAMRGGPYRTVCGRTTKDVRMLGAASFSSALWPDAAECTLAARPISYAVIAFSTTPELRQDLGRRLAAVGRFVEEARGCPQDIEGVISGADIYLVQTRPQQGLQP